MILTKRVSATPSLFFSRIIAQRAPSCLDLKYFPNFKLHLRKVWGTAAESAGDVSSHLLHPCVKTLNLSPKLAVLSWVHQREYLLNLIIPENPITHSNARQCSMLWASKEHFKEIHHSCRDSF